jgi:hypothetical protein
MTTNEIRTASAKVKARMIATEHFYGKGTKNFGCVSSDCKNCGYGGKDYECQLCVLASAIESALIEAFATPSVVSPQPWTDKDLEKVCHQICCARSYDHDGEDIKVLRAFLATAAAPVGEPGRTLLPTYLQKNAPYRQCSKCGRKSWSDGEVGTICSMLQPDNSHCNGIMQLPPAAPPAQGAPTPEILAKWMIQHSFSTGHGESVQDLLNELSWQVRELRSGGESDKPGVKS